MLKFVYFAFCALFFGAGVYVWKVKNTGAAQVAPDDPVAAAPPAEDFRQTGALVEIAGTQITQEDVNWEYDLVTSGVVGNEELTPIPDLGPRLTEELKPLRKAIVANIIERKLLYAFVQQDKSFVFDEPSRYESCMKEWQETIKADQIGAQSFASKEGRNRLRARLCERSVLEQYLDEKLFADVTASPDEALEYYKNHRAEYSVSERVVIRQVLLGSDADAKRVRAQINTQNFADLARSKSIAPEGVDGGKLGPFTKSAIPAIFEMAFSMKKGEISPILKSPYGYHIMTLVEKLPRSELSFDQVKNKITKVLRRKQQEERYQKWVDKALASIAVSSPKPLW